MGASAGGLDALVSAFGHTRPRDDVAFVIVQHLAAEHETLLPEVLSKRTRLPVVAADDGAELAGGSVYVMRSSHDLLLSGGRFRCTSRTESSPHHPVDTFFSSLAEDRGPSAIGIVLSGTGRDGTLGAGAIRDAGGLVFVQEPATCGFDGMPRSVIDSGAANKVLAPDELIDAVYEAADLASSDRVAHDEEDAVRALTSLLSRAGPIDFEHYKPGTLLRRARNRQHDLGFDDLGSYVDFVSRTPDELARLEREALIGVSSFFRDAEAFELLERLALPPLFRTADYDGTIRAWTCGCSAGQEAYSLAISVSEAAKQAGVINSLKLFATDIDRHAIARASAGVFDSEVQAEIPSGRLDHYLTRTPTGFRVSTALRSNVVFSVHDALRDPPFSRLDIVSCRNLLIYLQPSAQRRLLARFASALKPGGILFLGGSESSADLAEAFDVVDARWRLFRRRPGPLRAELRALSFGASVGRSANPSDAPSLVDVAQRALVRLDSPPTLVVDESGVLLHTTAPVNEFFRLPLGSASLNIVKLARGSLGTILSVALANARRSNEAVEYEDVEVRTDEGESVRVYLRVAPFTDAACSVFYLVSIRRLNEALLPEEAALAAPEGAFEHLQNELSATRENLQAVIEELETANEELQRTNNELLASNQELQSTNEELQSMNEELATANTDREHRIQDLIELNADLDGLLASTRIGTLFLDHTLAVRRFTPSVVGMIPLLDRDIGRPLAHLQHRLQGTDLDGVGRRVLETGAFVERTCRTPSGEVLLRAVPYEVRGRTQGVVISFIDISELAAARARLEGVMNSLPEQVAVLDGEARIVQVNEAWRRFSVENGGPEEAALGSSYLSVADAIASDDPDAAAVAVGLRSVLAGQARQFAHEYRCDSPTEQRYFLMHAQALGPGQGAVVSHIDVTPVARANRELRESEHLYRTVFAMSPEPLLLVDPTSGTIVRANTAAKELLGQAGEAPEGTALWRVLVPAQTTWERLFEEVRERGSIPKAAFSTKAVAGEPELEGSLDTVPSRGATCVLVRVHQHSTVATERARLARRLTQAQKMEALGLLAGGVAHELNNVLTAIQAVVFARRDELKTDDPAGRDLDSVLAATRRGADLTRNLLGFARSGSVTRERFDVREVASEVVGLLERSAPENIRFSLDKADVPCPVLGDRSQVAQALMNLCVNAIDAVHGKGHIRVEVGNATEGDRRSAFLRVTDDGIGMDSETTEKAFEPFFTTKPRGEGTGLGLSMVYGVGKSHGGWTEIRSRVGEGTTVLLGLPLAREGAAPEEPAATPQGSGERVLVVDDDALVRGSMARLLKRRGFVADVAADGPSALERLSKPGAAPVDIVLLDISMPTMDGLAVLAEIRRTRPTLPVLLHSGYPDQPAESRLHLDEHTAFLSKPVDIHTLTLTIASRVAAARRAEGLEPAPPA
ncbi:MAG: response regulator [Myxococcales bacterium]|nr:response regulator [Myxococcales bacterium]